MDFYLFEKTDKTITIKFKGTDTTLISPIMDMLDKDEDVKIVRFINKHPELEDPALVVETREGDPVAAIKRAADAVSEYYGTINKQ